VDDADVQDAVDARAHVAAATDRDNCAIDAARGRSKPALAVLAPGTLLPAPRAPPPAAENGAVTDAPREARSPAPRPPELEPPPGVGACQGSCAAVGTVHCHCYLSPASCEPSVATLTWPPISKPPLGRSPPLLLSLHR
jgi:hypothetical protein